MRDGNVRVQEKFELSLDGRQIASIVVGALVILAVVFVLGLNVGRQVASRQAAAAPGGDLSALDHVPAPDAQPKITFYDQLPRNRPPAPPPPERPSAPPAAPPPAQPEAGAAPTPMTPPPSPAAAVADAASAGGATVAAAVAARPPPERERDTATAVQGAAPARPATSARAAAPASRSGASGGAFTVQLAAATSRGDAERLASRYASIGARVESADVAGKGRVYRVRAGRFPDRASAERYLKDVVRETGAKGFVAENR